MNRYDAPDNLECQNFWYYHGMSETHWRFKARGINQSEHAYKLILDQTCLLRRRVRPRVKS